MAMMGRPEQRRMAREAKRLEARVTQPKERVGVWLNSHLFVSAGDGKFPNRWWRFWQWLFLGWRWERQVI